MSCAVRHPFISLASIYVKGPWLERRETMNLERRTLSIKRSFQKNRLFFIIFFTCLRRNDKKSTTLVVVTIDYSWIGLSVWGSPVSMFYRPILRRSTFYRYNVDYCFDQDKPMRVFRFSQDEDIQTSRRD